MEALKKILNIIIDIFIVLVVLVSAVIAVVSITSRDSGVANLFGYIPFTVQSNSMSPVFEAGDLIVGKAVEENQTFEVGDVITYWTMIPDKNGINHSVLNTHRIVSAKPEGDKYQMFITRGDNNEADDKVTTHSTSVVALWSHKDNDGIRIKKLGSVFGFLRKPSGFFIAVVIPMIIFFIYELVRFITNFMNYNREKSKQAALEAAKQLMGDSSSDSSGLSEEQKAQAILDYLEKQKAEQAAAPPVEESPKAEETEQAAMDTTAAVTDPEQEETVSEASED